MKCPSCRKEIPDSSLICIFCNAVFSPDGKVISKSKSTTLRAGKIKYRIIITSLSIAVIFIIAAGFTIMNNNKKKTIDSHRNTCLGNLNIISQDIGMYMQDTKNGSLLPPNDPKWVAIIKDANTLTCPASGMAPGTVTYGYNGNIAGKSISSFTGNIDAIPLISECNNATHIIMTDADVVKNRHQKNGVTGYTLLTLSGVADFTPGTVAFNWNPLSTVSNTIVGTPVAPAGEGATVPENTTPVDATANTAPNPAPTGTAVATPVTTTEGATPKQETPTTPAVTAKPATPVTPVTATPVVTPKPVTPTAPAKR